MHQTYDAVLLYDNFALTQMLLVNHTLTLFLVMCDTPKHCIVSKCYVVTMQYNVSMYQAFIAKVMFYSIV